MKKFLAVVLAVVMMCGVVMAQENLGTKAGDKSLNFAFGGLGAFNIGTPNTYGGVSLSYFLSGDAAVRFGLNVGMTSTTTPTNVTGNSDAEGSTFDIGVGADYLMFMTGASTRVRPYMGGGVSIGLGSSSNKYSVDPTINNETVERTNLRAADGFALGLNGIVGAEFYLYPEMSLSAEYRLGLLSLSSGADSVTKTEGAADVTAKGTSGMNILGFGATAVMLHIYF
ncbi:MAG: outer membrane beta-barrel protein [Bacteroidota bacterium]